MNQISHFIGTLLILLISFNGVSAQNSYQVSTFAGSGVSGSTDGIGVAATLSIPTGIAIDLAGNIFVADSGTHKIRKITPAGFVTTFAGSGDFGHLNGTGTNASFASPRGLAADSSGNIYVADVGNHAIRKITPAGVVTTLAGSFNGSSGSVDGSGTAARFYSPTDVAVDPSGNIFVVDSIDRKVRKITPAGVVTTFAGSGSSGSVDGVGINATFTFLNGIAVGSNGDVYVADSTLHKIRKITPAGVVTTYAGSGSAGSVDGIGASASFYDPRRLALDSNGNIYVSETQNQKTRKGLRHN